MAVDRLDAVVIGASVEGLVAAAALATAGKAVAVVERRSDAVPLGEGHDAVIDARVVRELDLTAHGMRFAAAPPLVGVTGERALILWPELHAAQASVAAHSSRDAEALEGFYARIGRAALAAPESAAGWLTSGETEPSDATGFRVSSIARLLDEAFDNEALKGLLAQSAVMGTGAAPQAPASGQLLTRTSLLALAAPSAGHRFVAGGERRLRQALLALLKFYNNADVAFGLTVREIAVDREVVQGVVLTDGNVLRAPQVISTLSYERSKEMILGLRRALAPYVPPKATVEPAQIKLTVGVLPKLPGVDAATLTSGAIVRLHPSLKRLSAAHGAFRALAAPVAPCLELRVAPLPLREGKARWDVFVSMPYVPVTTAEGPWTGARREKLRSIAVREIDAVVPGFGASIEQAEILHPAESETLMDPRGASLLAARAMLDQTAVPEAGVAGAASPVKGLSVVEPSLYGGVGDAGLIAAAAGSLSKARADA
jgi:phytoene dehydrogenase-like protein